MSKSVSLDSQRSWDLITHCPAYVSTPLKQVELETGICLLLKAESSRFNLGAFKALGGIYAIAIFLLDHWQQQNDSSLDPGRLFDQEIQSWSNQFTFVCASAGNHGMAVAKGAQLFNANSRVFLADTVPESFAKQLCDLGAEVVRSGATYEDSMNAALIDCENSDPTQILLADSSWPGYTEMPRLVMEGYTVMAEELRQAFVAGNDWPSHVFLQAGVGGLAAAMTYHIREFWQVQPMIIVVEPEAAPCLLESNRQGQLTTVPGPVSSMGRLDCKEPSMLAFEILHQGADAFCCVSDDDADNAAVFLEGQGLRTTASGAAGVAALLAAEQLNIDLTENSSCLCIVTEGPV